MDPAIFYDADCQACVNVARWFQRSLGRHHFELVPLQTSDASSLLGVTHEQLLDEMRLRLPDGQVFGGADAVAEIARQIWWAWPFWALSKMPGVRSAMRVAYRWFALHRSCTKGACVTDSTSSIRSGAILPLVTFPVVAFLVRSAVPAWVFMWAMAFALYAGCKWLTFRDVANGHLAINWRRAVGYLFAWPGMDATAFLSHKEAQPTKPSPSEWIAAGVKTSLGIALTWLVARTALPRYPLLAGWIGMIGLVFVLHFGVFHVLSLVWRTAGVQAMPLMCNPLRSTSLAEFWGRRWNTAFHELAIRFTFRPLRRLTGVTAASLVVFFISGLIHELVISLPAHGGYGLPTGYFLLQGLGIVAERTQLGHTLRLGQGLRGWVFTVVMTAGPAFLLFPSPFIRSVILPMLAAVGAN